MRKNSSEFVTGFVSEPGTFRANKDYFAFVELDDLACWIAVDGIDSDEEKESAEIVAQSIFTKFLEAPTLARYKLKKYIKNAHKILKMESRNVRLKASLVMMVTDYSKMVWIVSGNARLYHFRNKRLNFASRDQSIAQLMKESGKINGDELNEHEERNNLTNYLGTQKNFTPYVSRKTYLNDGDAVLLCTAGFWENITNAEIIDQLKDVEEPGILVDSLEEALLQKQSSVLNNYTIAAVFANKIFKDNAESRAKFLTKVAKIAAIVAVALVLVVVLGLGVGKKVQAMKERQVKVMQLRTGVDKNESKGDQLVKDGQFGRAFKAYGNALAGLQTFKAKDLDAAKESRIQSKYDTTKLISDADDDFTNKKYQMALTGYTQADMNADSKYDRKKLQERIEKAKGYIAVLNLVELGDSLFEQNKFQEAQQKYNQAKTIADKVSFEDMKSLLEAKTATANTKFEEDQDKKKKLASAQRFEKQAHQKYNAKKFKEALDFYVMAKSIYEGLDMTDELMAVQTKIQDCEIKKAYYQRLEEGKNYERQGDDKFNLKKYTESWELYNSAKNVYIEINASDDIARIEPKIKIAAKKKRFLLLFKR